MQQNLGRDLIIKEAHAQALLQLINSVTVPLDYIQKKPYMDILESLRPVNTTMFNDEKIAGLPKEDK